MLIWLFVCVVGTQALAHEMPKSTVFLDFRSDRVEAELRLPIDRLQIAIRHDLTGQDASDAAAMLGVARPRVASYILDHVQATNRHGASWSVRLSGLREDGNDLIAQLELKPSDNASADVLRG